MRSEETGVLSGYNARSWSSAKIASGFVAPDEYWLLIDGGDNQSLVGPRGTGKTTLLKMLCGPALEAWTASANGSDAERARQAVDFTGVFIPANKMWSGQVFALTRALDEDEDRDRFGLGAFAYMGLRALVEAAEHRAHGPDVETPHRRVELPRDSEAELAAQVAVAFGAPNGAASLRALRVALSRNVAGLGRLLRRVGNHSIGERERASICASPLLDVDFYSAASLFCTVFDDLVQEPEAGWAFLLDELEFLPVGARAEIAQSVQGQDPKLRFKVSLAPWKDASLYLQGVPFNDFTQVALMPGHREAAHAFAERLFTQEIRSRGRTESPHELLGSGGFEPATVRDSYAESGENTEMIRELATQDASFGRWLARHKIDPDEDLTSLNEAQTGQLRKAAPLVRLRLAYGKPGQRGERVGRSRKRPPDLYAGTQSIWAMSEGNPRWLKAFAHELFALHTAQGQAAAHLQLEAVSNVADNYFGYFRTMESMPDAPPAGELSTPYHLLIAMGSYFERQVHAREFTADPVTMARPNPADRWTDALINALVFLGGLVRQEDTEGERVRLSHMFAPRFRLPPRNGSAAPISAIMAGTSPEQLSLIDAVKLP